MISNAFYRRLLSQQTFEFSRDVFSKPLAQLPTELCFARLCASALDVRPVVRAMISATIDGRPQGWLLVT